MLCFFYLYFDSKFLNANYEFLVSYLCFKHPIRMKIRVKGKRIQESCLRNRFLNIVLGCSVIGWKDFSTKYNYSAYPLIVTSLIVTFCRFCQIF